VSCVRKTLLLDRLGQLGTSDLLRIRWGMAAVIGLGNLLV